MGMAIIPFFGDISKEELEKELARVTEKRAKLDEDIVNIKVALALKAREGSAEN